MFSSLASRTIWSHYANILDSSALVPEPANALAGALWWLIISLTPCLQTFFTRVNFFVARRYDIWRLYCLRQNGHGVEVLSLKRRLYRHHVHAKCEWMELMSIRYNSHRNSLPSSYYVEMILFGCLYASASIGASKLFGFDCINRLLKCFSWFIPLTDHQSLDSSQSPALSLVHRMLSSLALRTPSRCGQRTGTW